MEVVQQSTGIAPPWNVQIVSKNRRRLERGVQRHDRCHVLKPMDPGLWAFTIVISMHISCENDDCLTLTLT